MIGLVQTILLLGTDGLAGSRCFLLCCCREGEKGKTGELWDSFPIPAQAIEAAILPVAGLDTQELCSKCYIHRAYKYTVVPRYLRGICFKTPVDA